ncbi:hypothetical protein CONLIGDRAFT_320035 [Coniochaeta ligniaria NRRL 30616]|uniref:Uncharacterized protein n=1 Tax=Coniochaeta ligniaria NRRL 30616 TaxID=1408157 RepID=A0A1J7I3X2_9PEZI|nr:hypothetical protein CONLIGDRAFT_320035 [Coniochaeta ligniaria NRRL 30616]
MAPERSDWCLPDIPYPTDTQQAACLTTPVQTTTEEAKRAAKKRRTKIVHSPGRSIASSVEGVQRRRNPVSGCADGSGRRGLGSCRVRGCVRGGPEDGWTLSTVVEMWWESPLDLAEGVWEDNGRVGGVIRTVGTLSGRTSCGLLVTCRRQQPA